MEKTSNNFDALRLLASFMVVAGHASPLIGLPQPPDGVMDGYRWLTNIGVHVFFPMSGYLISKSWANDPSGIRFLIRRILRIMPSLVTVVFISTFVIGPIFTELSLSAYFSHPDTYRYLQTALLYPVHFWLPGLFATNPYPGINGSLWTLPLEFTMYLMVMGIGITCGRSDAKKLVALLFLLITFFWHSWFGENFVFAYLSSNAFATNGIYFVCGAILYQIRKHVRLPIVPGIVMLGCTFFLPSQLRGYVFPFPFSYTVIAVAEASIPYARSAGKHGDFSYGLYIYAFPMGEILAHLFPATNVVMSIFLTTLLALICATISWHVIERPMLSLKPNRMKIPQLPEVVHAVASTPLDKLHDG